MKISVFKRFVSFFMALLLCAGCAANASPTGDSSPGLSAGDNAIRLENATADSLDYAAERPAIDDMAALTGSTGQTMQASSASVQFSNGKQEEVKAVWISYLEMDTLLKNKSKAQFTKNIGQVFDNVKDFQLNTVVVQVRPFGDALYNSEYFPWSYTITGTEGKDPGFDPLEIMIAEAKKRDLRFEAWINPYRVRASGNNTALSADNQAKIWLDAGDSAVIKYNGFISYNPASEKARTHIVNGIREIIRNYDIDAIHIDDYFYPTTDAAFDKSSYNAYQQGGGKLSLGDWRRSNVEDLIKSIYKAVKEEDSNVLFGISPQGNVEINYNGQFFDVKKIAANPGYCDYLCPQVYYGFNNENQPFATVVKNWNDMVKDSPVDLYIGIAAYKLGNQDNWAGSGKNEWVNTSTKLKDMVETSRELSSYSGFVLYRYDSLFRPATSVKTQVDKECKNLKGIL